MIGRQRPYKFFLAILPAVLCLSFFSACGGMHGSGDPPVNTSPNPVDPNGRIPNTLGNMSLGNGGGSGLTPLDSAALNNLTNQTNDTNPSQGTDTAVMQALEAEAQQLLQQEAKGGNVSQQKILIATKMMQECAKMIVALAPKPGQPLLGQWAGRGCKKNGGGKNNGNGFAESRGTFQKRQTIIPFTILPGDPVSAQQGRYIVRGGTNGQMGATQNGDGVVAAQPWQGNITDKPTAAGGVLNNAKYNKNDAGYGSCAMGVILQRSANPIPENYIEGMRRATQCYRRTLIFVSPIGDSLFQGMDPTLAALLQTKLLGLGSSGDQNSAQQSIR